MKEIHFIPSMKRRCLVHDYRNRSIYLITLEVAARRPLLGRIVNSSDEIPLSVSMLDFNQLKAVNEGLFAPSTTGRLVAEEFLKIGEHVEGVEPLLAQAMPDHFHGVLFVSHRINRSLGSIIAGFKGKCTQIARLRANEAPMSLWEAGFHDRILTDRGQLVKMMRYVLDNPRRAALRRSHRDLFTTLRRVVGARGRSFDAYGNMLLLERPNILPVQCSRRFFGYRRDGKLILRDAAGCPAVLFQTVEFANLSTRFFEAVAQGSILCSPCISDGEKAISYAAVDAGHPLIVLRAEPFPPHFKPSGKFFDACAQGRLLLLHPQGLTPLAPNGAVTRAVCLELNAIASEICGT